MPVESTADLAVFFNADEFGVEASYAPPGGGGSTACAVLLDRQDRDVRFGEGRPVIAGTTIDVRAAEVASPARGGTFVIGGTTYTIAADPIAHDADRKIWRCTVR